MSWRRIHPPCGAFNLGVTVTDGKQTVVYRMTWWLLRIGAQLCHNHSTTGDTRRLTAAWHGRVSRPSGPVGDSRAETHGASRESPPRLTAETHAAPRAVSRHVIRCYRCFDHHSIQVPCAMIVPWLCHDCGMIVRQSSQPMRGNHQVIWDTAVWLPSQRGWLSWIRRQDK